MIGFVLRSMRTLSRRAPRSVAMGRVAALAPAACVSGQGSGQGLTAGPGGAVAAEPAVGSSAVGSYLAGRFAGDRRDTEAAIQYLTAVLKADPRSPDLLRATFMLAASDGRMDMALALAERLAEADKSDPFAPVALAVGDLKAGRFAIARDRLL